ncbi:MAG TPA: hypothetical protein PKO15_03735 [Fibrobacteria bacterium]|nr:hypothetical protein [Fibrobacteria bacterium]HOX52396.1 hypothetical protein [Fibrobacteria bacterium]
MSRRLLAFAAVLGTMSCEEGRADRPPATTTDSIHTDLPRLGRILKWDSLAPRSATYRISILGSPSSRAPGPTDWSLEALLRYDSATLRKLLDVQGSDSMTDSVTSGVVAWSWLDTVDNRTLDKGIPLVPGENHVFSSQGCPNGTIQAILPDILLVDCRTR